MNKKKPNGLQTFGSEEQYTEYRSCFDYSAFYCGFQVQDVVCLFCCLSTVPCAWMPFLVHTSPIHA